MFYKRILSVKVELSEELIKYFSSYYNQNRVPDLHNAVALTYVLPDRKTRGYPVLWWIQQHSDLRSVRRMSSTTCQAPASLYAPCPFTPPTNYVPVRRRLLPREDGLGSTRRTQAQGTLLYLKTGIRRRRKTGKEKEKEKRKKEKGGKKSGKRWKGKKKQH